MTQSQSRSRGRSKRMETKETLRVVTYRRISTNEVNQPHSLEAQEHSLGDYIARTPGLVHVGDFYDMQTGTRTDRPGLEALLTAAQGREFDLVLFYRTDRLARSVHGFMEILQQLEEFDVALRSATEPFETMTPAGKLMAQMLASFAEFEHDVLIDRILEGFSAKALKGEWLGGRAPYGYANDREHQTLSIVPDEATTVRRIYRRYLAGLGAKAISEELNGAGVLYRGGQRWNQQAVLRLLASPTNAGLLERNDEYFPGQHEAIVSRETFDRAMALRQTKVVPDQYVKMAAGNSEFFLSGVVRCGACGGAVVGAAANSKGHHYRYYDCSMKTKRAESERCRTERVDADTLEDMVVDQLLSAYRDSDLFATAVAMAVAKTPGHVAELDEQIATAEAALAHSTTAMGRYYSAFESGELHVSELRGRLDRLQEMFDAQRDELSRLQRQRSDMAPRETALVDLAAALERIEAALSAPQSWQSKRRLVGALVESIVVSPGRQVQVTLRVPTVDSDGPSRVLPGGRPRRGRSGPRPTSRHRQTARETAAVDEPPSDLISTGLTSGQTPFRLGSHMVEMLGIEPRSISFLVNILRAQLAGDCRERHCCQRR